MRHGEHWRFPATVFGLIRRLELLLRKYAARSGLKASYSWTNIPKF